MELKCQWMVLPELGPKAPHAKMLPWSLIFTGIMVYFRMFLERTSSDIQFIFFLPFSIKSVHSLALLYPASASLCALAQQLHGTPHYANMTLCWCTVCYKIRSLSLHVSEEVSHVANFNWASLDYVIPFILSKPSSSSVFIPLAHSIFLDSFKFFQNTLSRASLSNLHNAFHHVWHNCQYVKLRIWLRKHLMLGSLLEEDTVCCVRYLGSLINNRKIILNHITWHTGSQRAYLSSTKPKDFKII